MKRRAFYFMKYVLRGYQYINALSLDVAVGAAICALFFSRFFGVILLPQGIAALALAVWIIYTADHLFDARKMSHRASTFRHRVHQDHFKTLLILLTLASLIELSLIFFLRKPLFYAGLWLGAGVLIYILVNRLLIYVKEVSGAILYTCGVLLPVLSLRAQPFLFYEKLIVLQFALIALVNLVLFSWMDFDSDLRDKNRSLVTLLGEAKVKKILVVLFASTAVINLITMRVYWSISLVFLLMYATLLLLFLFADYFRQYDRFRLIGDGVFFLPALALVW